jgi:SAM-dependent methyltransferase
MKAGAAKSEVQVTRGYGLLEKFLAGQRGRMADSLIPARLRKGRILDIGCGAYPLFLYQTDFSEKYALDQMDLSGEAASESSSVRFVRHDFAGNRGLPFPDNHFNVVVMLAFIEHVEPSFLPAILSEALRILKPGGNLIMTTPARWTDKLLRLLAFLRLVSPVEIAEHKMAYRHDTIIPILQSAGFAREQIAAGYFELFMNLWVLAVK